ncbi:MAG: hypothetical protein KatS3mg068_1184 [Candidatus Sericytochromatia bacterium]|nr:MAG: hypothetical protein KatS3mg068_1184 [Candidatus Sericytochromatia bacterium]
MDISNYEKNFKDFSNTIINKDLLKEKVLIGYKFTINDKNNIFDNIVIIYIRIFINIFYICFRLPMIKDSFNISQVTLGYLWVIIEFAKIIGSFFVVSYYEKFNNKLKGLIILPIFSSLILIGAKFYSGTILMLVLFFIFEFLEPFYNSLKK